MPSQANRKLASDAASLRATLVGQNLQFKYRHVGEFDGVVLSLPYCPGWAEIPLLANDFSKRMSVIRRPSQDKLLGALDFGLLENQPDTFQLLRVVEQESNDLGSGLSRAPAASLAELQRTLDGICFIFEVISTIPKLARSRPSPSKGARSRGIGEIRRLRMTQLFAPLGRGHADTLVRSRFLSEVGIGTE